MTKRQFNIIDICIELEWLTLENFFTMTKDFLKTGFKIKQIKKKNNAEINLIDK